eukprot:3465823-Pyramimonas_sp.AAC.1
MSVIAVRSSVSRIGAVPTGRRLQHRPLARSTRWGGGPSAIQDIHAELPRLTFMVVSGMSLFRRKIQN